MRRHRGALPTAGSGPKHGLARGPARGPARPTLAPAGLRVAGLVLAGVVLAACGPGPAGAASPSGLPPTPASASAAASASAPVPASPAVGLVVSIDSSGLAQVHGFTLRTADGQVLTFTIGTLENGDQFPPGHLAEHQATAQPVRVYFRAQDGRLVVYRLEDGG